MIRHYFKIAWRNLIKNKGYSIINIGGLAIGMTAYLLITQYVNFESNYDQYHPRIDDLYRVTLSMNWNDKGFEPLAPNHPSVGPTMKEDFPEVESYTRLWNNKNHFFGPSILSYTNEQGIKIKSNVSDDNIYFADSTVLDIFHIPLIYGDKKTALVEPASIILSNTMAKRFFGNQNPINKNLLSQNNEPLKVTGVFEDLPENTHLNLDMIISMSTNQLRQSTGWKNPVFYTYVRLKSGTNPTNVISNFSPFIKKYLGEIMKEHGFEAKMDLQPVRDIHLKSHYGNEIAANGNQKTLYFLQLISLFVIFIALVNFINLSTAKSTERAMEVGLKKVVGIRKSSLIFQFLFESIAINVIAAIITIILVSLLIQLFNELVGLHILSLDLWLQPQIWMQLVSLIMVGGLLAGAYPAFVLSNFKPIEVLKGKYHQSGKGAFMRKILVVAQFTVSITLIAGTVIMYSQFSYMQDKELGFNAKQNLVLYAPRVVDSTIINKLKVFKEELLKNPKINFVSGTTDVPGKRITMGNLARQIHENKERGEFCGLAGIDTDFIDTYQLKLLAGRNFRLGESSVFNTRNPEYGKKEIRVILNKEAVKKLGFTSVDEALNKNILFQFGNPDHKAKIIGVLDNYHNESLQTYFQPIIYLYGTFYRPKYLTVNTELSEIQSTLGTIKIKYEELFISDPFKYFFLDEYFNHQYEADLKFGRIFLLFAGFAIFIAILGLFGLGSYMALKRTKELCVRKVLGANIVQILVLIPKSLLILVLLSGVIALPLTYYLASEWLNDYAFRIDLNIWMFLFPLLLVILIAALSVLPESIKASLVKPVNYLRNE